MMSKRIPQSIAKKKNLCILFLSPLHPKSESVTIECKAQKEVILLIFFLFLEKIISHIPQSYFDSEIEPYGFLMFSGGRERVRWERMS